MIDNVKGVRERERLAWAARQVPLILLAVITSALAAGGILHLSGAGAAGDAAWLAAGACGSAYALWAMADALRQRRIGVDVIALLALVGAIAVALGRPQPPQADQPAPRADSLGEGTAEGSGRLVPPPGS